jgi:hypothetical protein
MNRTDGAVLILILVLILAIVVAARVGGIVPLCLAAGAIGGAADGAAHAAATQTMQATQATQAALATQKRIARQFSKFRAGKTPTFAEFCYPKSYTVQKQQQFAAAFMDPSQKRKALLVFHKIGAGKTCLAIQIAERWKAHGPPLCLMPASLIPGFRNELRSPCAPSAYITDAERAVLATLVPGSAEYNKIVAESDRRIDAVYQILSYNAFAGEAPRLGGEAPVAEISTAETRSTNDTRINEGGGGADNADDTDDASAAVSGGASAAVSGGARALTEPSGSMLAEPSDSMLAKPSDSMLAEPSIIIVDEVQNVTNPSGTFFKTILEYVERHPLVPVVLMTGTPVFDSPRELASIARLLRLPLAEAVAEGREALAPSHVCPLFKRVV